MLLSLPRRIIIEITTRVQSDNDMNPDEVFTVRLRDGFVYELYGNWKDHCGWNSNASEFHIVDDLMSDCLVVRRRPLERSRKSIYRNFDRSLPHPIEIIELRIAGKKRTFFTYLARGKEDSRVYQMDSETGTQFLRRIERILRSKHLI